MKFEYLWIMILCIIALAWVLYVLSSMRPILTRQLVFKEWWMIAKRDDVTMVGLIIAVWVICIVFFVSLVQYLSGVL